MQVAPITLQGREIRLEPLTLDHAPALWRQADPAIFAYIPHPVDDTLPAFETYLSGLLRAPGTCKIDGAR
jgi:hypothetical protein